ncbi:BQ5605_C006g04067 [Microbotryum silenes-dioicae]|uniref:BQ5605_C006g04067 protein n=1 Tax=Microbotryum silenes-dioicae TaxID=796604 RepID=A0A2X0P1R8_9BASI|nr:BQ5605_C006g04067 [Microbotryum silenes-dioicae]
MIDRIQQRAIQSLNLCLLSIHLELDKIHLADLPLCARTLIQVCDPEPYPQRPTQRRKLYMIRLLVDGFDMKPTELLHGGGSSSRAKRKGRKSSALARRSTSVFRLAGGIRRRTHLFDGSLDPNATSKPLIGS